jgi:ATP adenylyltransferase
MRIYTPKRKEYDKRIAVQKHCEFCDGKVVKRQYCPSLEGEHWYVLAASYPYLNGNVMIIPKRHIERLERVASEEWMDLQKVLIRTQDRLGKLFGTRDFNIGINIGKNSGASIRHLHWQVIPRTKKQHPTVLSLLADLHLISVSGDDLRKMIEGT